MAIYNQSQNIDPSKATYGEQSGGVANLQTYLNSKGANITVDGKYGDQTQKAVNQYGLPNSVPPISPTPVNTQPQAITPESLTPQNPINLPTTNQTTIPTSTNYADNILNSLDVPQTETQNTGDALLAKIFEATGNLSGQTQELAKQQEIAGVNAKKAELQSINNQIINKTAEINQSDIQLIADQRAEERRDTLLPFAQEGQAKLAGDAAILRALKTSEIGVLNAQALAKQGDIALAIETAQQAVDLKYAPYKDNIATWQAQYNAIKPLLDKDEKKQGLAMELKGKMALEEIQKVADFQKDALKNAIQNNAPQSIISKINNAHTVDEITAVGSDYIVSPSDKLDLLLKKAQINKINSEILDNTTDKTVSLSTATLPNGKPDVVSEAAQVIDRYGGKSGVPSASSALGVMASLQKLVLDNPNGQFIGSAPIKLAPGLTRGKDARSQRIKNRVDIEGINLKVQQWASGAALTDKQTKQVMKMVPDSNDTDAKIREKINSLTNLMQQQVKSELASKGIDYTPTPVSYFSSIGGLQNDATSNYLDKIDSVFNVSNSPYSTYLTP